MIPILDFQRRALEGKVMKANQFDLAFSKTMRALVKRHAIERAQEATSADDATADAVFDAAVALLAEVGLYHLDTQRVVEFTDDEIRQVAQEYCANPPEAVFGRGADELRIRYRRGNEARPPILASGPAGEIEQSWFHAYVRSFVEEPAIRALGIAGGITAVDGCVPKAGTPSEMICSQWECEQLLEIARTAGRPDMHLGLLCTANSVAAIMACIRPGLREPHNTQIGIHIMPEQKINWERLMLAKFCEDRGITPWTSCVSIMGGLCRRGPDVAVGLVANLLGQLSYGHGKMAGLFTNRMNGAWGDAESLWALSAAARAAERHIRVPIIGVCAPCVELGRTPAGFYQGAAVAMAQTASGLAYAWIAGGSGPEAVLNGDVMKAVAGLPRDQVDELVEKALAESVAKTDENTAMREFTEVFDIESARPLPSFAAELEQARETLAGLGVPLG